MQNSVQISGYSHPRALRCQSVTTCDPWPAGRILKEPRAPETHTCLVLYVCDETCTATKRVTATPSQQYGLPRDWRRRDSTLTPTCRTVPDRLTARSAPSGCTSCFDPRQRRFTWCKTTWSRHWLRGPRRTWSRWDRVAATTWPTTTPEIIIHLVFIWRFDKVSARFFLLWRYFSLIDLFGGSDGLVY